MEIHGEDKGLVQKALETFPLTIQNPRIYFGHPNQGPNTHIFTATPERGLYVVEEPNRVVTAINRETPGTHLSGWLSSYRKNSKMPFLQFIAVEPEGHAFRILQKQGLGKLWEKGYEPTIARLKGTGVDKSGSYNLTVDLAYIGDFASISADTDPVTGDFEKKIEEWFECMKS